MSTLPISEARAALVEAEEAQREERRKRLIEHLQQTRESLRVDSAELEKMRGNIMVLQEAFNANRRSLEMLTEMIGLHAERRPPVYSYLPNDPESLAWSKKERDLKEQHAHVLSERLALPNIELLRLEGVRLKQARSEFDVGGKLYFGPA